MLNMTREETLATLYGEMLDMIDALAIYNGVAKIKKIEKKLTYDEAINLR